MDKEKEIKELRKKLSDKEAELHEMHEAFLESMMRFRDLYEQSPIGVGIHNTKGELLIVNNSYLNIFGINSFSDIAHDTLQANLELSPLYAEKIHSGQIIQYEAEYNFDNVNFKTKHKGKKYFLYTISALLRGDKVTGYMAHVQDVTERKKIEMSQRLVQMGRLLADMAHEVNNPLMVVTAWAEVGLVQNEKNEKLKEIFDVIHEQCGMAKEIINRLLKYARVGKSERVSIDMKRTLEFIANILQQYFKTVNIKFAIDIENELPLIIANEKQIQEVLMNIMRNSADAMPNGGTIKIKALKQDDSVRIEIEDDGEGMLPEVLEKIFDPFFTTKAEGTGLGLAVCHNIIREHGGDLRYESEPGKGTLATIMLPIEL